MQDMKSSGLMRKVRTTIKDPIQKVRSNTAAAYVRTPSEIFIDLHTSPYKDHRVELESFRRRRAAGA